MQIKSLFFIAVTAVSVAAVSCSTNNSSTKNTEVNNNLADTASAPVETGKANSNYQPAFVGQTRIAGVKTSTAYNVEKIAENIGKPWAVIPLPGERLLVTDKSGFMQVFSTDGSLVKKITGLNNIDAGGQGGLLDVALDPAFAQNNTIYWAYSEKSGSGNLTAVAKGQLDVEAATIKNPTTIFRALPYLDSKMHYGSRLIFDKDGFLFVTVGEKSVLEGRKQAQFLNSGLGKIFKITQEGKPAPGNPFLNQENTMPEIYSYGHRNPQGMDLHPVTGELWETEFGPRGGDELNLIKPGKNYGWPTITYGIEYDGGKVGAAIQKQEGMEQPVYYWDPVLSPSGMVFYAGDAIPEWKNNLFIGGLNSLHISRLVIENNKVVGEERLLADKKERIRDIAYHDGKLYAVTDGGIIFKISKK
ncbi:MAG: PQQ-dependent sugar dehydrogenase [Gloeobacteraceae cyanobacterium ES-bin-316]|nr:PQQ-dependent sugar dehydrogenase [Ferruginibacter sp.]